MLEKDREKLQSWFEAESRDFPWRVDPTPYAVWVSEVMLQQTRASVVISYFVQWMKKFPSIETLANSSQAEVIKAWEGLGYYSRARNLHEGARYVMAHFDGILPADALSLKKIKGLGPYTIGAILSFAFHQRVAAVDGNVLRVLARYYHVEDDISKPKTVKDIQVLAHQLLPESKPWVVSEALIELGATLCGRSPQCTVCPIRAGCQARLRDATQRLPNKSKKHSTTHLKRAVGLIRHDEKLLVRRCLPGEIMADLWEFPYLEVPTEQQIDRQMLKLYFEQQWKLNLKWAQALPEVSQAFTRYKVTLHTHLFHALDKPEIAGYEWLPMAEFKNIPLSSGHRRIFNTYHADEHCADFSISS
jgi:A/G-specific adenine glycosylase